VRHEPVDASAFGLDDQGGESAGEERVAGVREYDGALSGVQGLLLAHPAALIRDFAAPGGAA
jgi:hypothetical protein